MLNYPPRKSIDTKASCSYELAMLVAKRARQLVDGAQPLVPDEAANMVSLACIEVNEDKVVGVHGTHDKEIVVPKTREAIQAEKEERRKRQESQHAKEIAQLADAEQEKLEEPVDAESFISTFDENEEITMVDDDDDDVSEDL